MTKRTLGGTKRKAIRVSGFLTRMKTKNGRKVISTRRRKKRKQLSI
jgi:large subunit ribosomal protein L34